MEISSAAIAFTGLALAWSMHIAAFVWWLSKQFSETRALVFKQDEKIHDALREHERADETRFRNLELTIAGRRRADGR